MMIAVTRARAGGACEAASCAAKGGEGGASRVAAGRAPRAIVSAAATSLRALRRTCEHAP
ncbi:hypothetical protein WM28_02185 [Burkholderia ubonensis]|nr:hypothetical protein WM28_02185 [Burkholderia ubonensis]